ncbi:hypothetical protein [Verrucosispora sp. WMMD573]|uniref:hypothetical protein n=1 Tax=Verrucosispora sp. WMMD573 TaxID=3015149 RepID=UPI00248C2A88|nr:hypothetical protein [Verrucosispora sp. WMMD573]WBB53359.1 hypothetical protein O7601_22735 [Verrucosispora sp. WMMD573]
MPDEPELTGDWSRIPAEQTAAFERWARVKRVSVDIVRYQQGGFSGTPIALVVWREPGQRDRQRFLRFYEGQTGEIERARDAYVDSPPTFVRRHLPAAQLESLGDSWVAVFDVAAGDLLACPPLTEVMTQSDFPTQLRTIVQSVAHDWNQPPPASQQRTTTVGGYLSELLDGRPERRGTPGARLRAWAKRAGVPAEQARVQLGWWRSELPNPLAFLAGTAPRSSEELSLLTGRTHGDLNIGNILVQTEPTLDGNGYQLIDLGGYHNDGPLARDPMHLLLSMVAHWLRTSTRIEGDTGTELIRALLRAAPATDPRPELLGHAEVSAAVHEAGRAIAAIQGFGERWRLQTLLSLAGCALLFADRNLRMRDEDQARGWFFTLAATALEEYLWQTRASSAAPEIGAQPAADLRRPTAAKPADGLGLDEVAAARESCAAIVHHLVLRARSPRGLIPEQVHLLLLDFGARAPLLDEAEHARLSVQAMHAFSPQSTLGDERDREATALSVPRQPSTQRPAPPTTGAAGRSTRRGVPGTLSAESARRADIAVLTSHPAEYRAALQVFVPEQASQSRATEIGRWIEVSAERADRPLSVYLARSPERLTPGRAGAVRNIVERFNPSAFFLVGTARGDGAESGHVVVPRWVGHYELLESGEMVTRVPQLWIPDYVRTLLAYYRRVNTRFQDLVVDFRKSAPAADLPAPPTALRPEIDFDGAVASGPPELMTAAALTELRDQDGRLAALDTESYEFGLWNERRLWAVFRGVVAEDVASSGSAAELFLAAGHAAACLKDFLEHEYLPE